MGTKKELPVWFVNRLKKVMEHNDYTNDMLTVDICTDKDVWTPTDLILREYYNNGGGSAKGFLGLTKAETIRCYEFIRENQEMLKEMNYYSEEGYNNFGFRLWHNYLVH